MSEVELKPKSITLPTKKVPALTKSPKNLVIFSKPKTGKTTLLAGLPNCLILDFEDGTDYIDAIKIKIDSLKTLGEVGNAIKAAGFPYEYIAVDTVSALEDMCVGYAEQLYNGTPMGKNWYTDGKLKYHSILNLPNGAGYPYLRQAFEKMIDFIKTLAPRVILLGHVKIASQSKEGGDFNSLDLDLTGKNKGELARNSDAIGYLYRKGNKNILSFKTSDEIGCGARPNHLKNKEIVISESLEDGTIKMNWDEIYID